MRLTCRRRQPRWQPRLPLAGGRATCMRLIRHLHATRRPCLLEVGPELLRPVPPQMCRAAPQKAAARLPPEGSSSVVSAPGASTQPDHARARGRGAGTAAAPGQALCTRTGASACSASGGGSGDGPPGACLEQQRGDRRRRALKTQKPTPRGCRRQALPWRPSRRLCLGVAPAAPQRIARRLLWRQRQWRGLGVAEVEPAAEPAAEAMRQMMMARVEGRAVKYSHHTYILPPVGRLGSTTLFPPFYANYSSQEAVLA